MNASMILTATAREETPLLAVDLDQARTNLREMARLVHGSGRDFYPHVKHHKSPTLAALQLEAGVAGLTCQKLGEAEVMVSETPVDHVLIPYEIVGTFKLQRLVALAGHVRLTTAVDDIESAQEIDRRCSEAGVEVELLLEIDTGYHRCGIQPRRTKEFVDALRPQRAARLTGVMTYAGHIYDCTTPEGVETAARKSYDDLGAAAQVLREAEIDPRVSVGASACHRVALEHPAVTEVRFGSYMLRDRANVVLGWSTIDDCALGVVSTVISVPTSQRIVLDVGSKGLGFATVPGHPGFGALLGEPEGVIDRLSDEHAMVTVPDSSRFRRGDRVVVVPNSHALATNLFDVLHPVSGGLPEVPWPIAARGRST